MNRPSGGIIFTTIQKFGLEADEDKFPESRSGYEIYYKDQSAGFITFEEQNNIWTGDTNVTIDLAYVRPEFRKLGIAAVAYRWAITHLNAKGISISYHRIHGRSAYWRALGFTKFANTHSLQRGNKNTLFYLVVPGVQDRLQELSDWAIKASKEEQSKKCSKMIKTGLYDYV
jgi:GNAT superfamily N-acetyltransferase